MLIYDGFSFLEKVSYFFIEPDLNLNSIMLTYHCDAKPFALGLGVGLDPQRHNFALPIPICWYLKTLKFAFPPTPNLKFALPPMRTPNVSQWNTGCVGSRHKFFTLALYISFFFVLISFAFCGQRKPSFQWNMGFKVFLNFLYF